MLQVSPKSKGNGFQIGNLANLPSFQTGNMANIYILKDLELYFDFLIFILSQNGPRKKARYLKPQL